MGDLHYTAPGFTEFPPPSAGPFNIARHPDIVVVLRLTHETREEGIYVGWDVGLDGTYVVGKEGFLVLTKKKRL